MTESATAPAQLKRADSVRNGRFWRRKAAPERDTDPQQSHPHSVMVIDDDAATARMISLALREDGYAVRSASDGQDALGKLEHDTPDLIVLDLEMPVMNGRTFYHELRARGLEMPVVVVSAFDAHAGQRELGASTYLTKPFDPDDLLDKVRALLE